MKCVKAGHKSMKAWRIGTAGEFDNDEIIDVLNNNQALD